MIWKLLSYSSISDMVHYYNHCVLRRKYTNLRQTPIFISPSRVYSYLIRLNPYGYRYEKWVLFYHFPLPQISLHHFSTLISFISFNFIYPPLIWCDRRGRPASLLFTDLQYKGFIASRPSIPALDINWDFRNFFYNFKSIFNFTL